MIDIERVRRNAEFLCRASRRIGDAKAQNWHEIAEAFLEVTEPDPRLATMRPCIQTSTGRYFFFLEPELFDWNIEDIAHGLALGNRFSGHTEEPYSIAQHSVLASEHIEDQSLAFEALMHDGHESFYGDFASPMKIIVPDYRRLKDKGEAAMRRKFGLPHEMSSEVKHIDTVMLATEKRDLMNPIGGDWFFLAGVKPLDYVITPWKPSYAKSMFLDRFKELWPAWRDNHATSWAYAHADLTQPPPIPSNPSDQTDPCLTKEET